MKTLLSLLIASLLMAETQTNLKVVRFYGNVINDVQLILEDDDYTFSIWYQGVRLKDDFMIVNCKAPERFCLVRKQDKFYGEIR